MSTAARARARQRSAPAVHSRRGAAGGARAAAAGAPRRRRAARGRHRRGAAAGAHLAQRVGVAIVHHVEAAVHVNPDRARACAGGTAHGPLGSAVCARPPGRPCRARGHANSCARRCSATPARACSGVARLRVCALTSPALGVLVEQARQPSAEGARAVVVLQTGGLRRNQGTARSDLPRTAPTSIHAPGTAHSSPELASWPRTGQLPPPATLLPPCRAALCRCPCRPLPRPRTAPVCPTSPSMIAARPLPQRSRVKRLFAICGPNGNVARVNGRAQKLDYVTLGTVRRVDRAHEFSAASDIL